MNYGMVLLYVFLSINLIGAAWVSSPKLDGVAMFCGKALNIAIILWLLAWSHGWHLTWATQ
jgi:hypothetical protein